MIFAVLAVMFMASPMANAQNVNNNEQAPKSDILEVADKMPTFQYGGFNDFRIWMMRNINYPETATVSGKVLVEFVVEKDGSVLSVKTLKSPSETLSAEAERVVKLSPKWNAGEHNGQKVRVKMVIPIAFFKQK